MILTTGEAAEFLRISREGVPKRESPKSKIRTPANPQGEERKGGLIKLEKAARLILSRLKAQ